MFSRLRAAFKALLQPTPALERAPQPESENEALRVSLQTLGLDVQALDAWLRQADQDSRAAADRIGYLISDQLNLALQQQNVMAERQLEFQRETRLLLANISLPIPQPWQTVGLTRPGAAQTGIFDHSTLCREDSFRADYFPYWTNQIQFWPIYHRKLWEFVFICQVLWERSVIKPGMRGLGFGVGGEPLTAYFAGQGCSVVATDMANEAAAEAGWIETAQHANGLASLRKPSICPDEVFDRNVEFRFCDMNAVPSDLTDFDFCWSACALEHLGSIGNGLRFIEKSVDCLKPGGFAVHTTEFNLSSDEETVDDAATVLFRRRDLETLAERLAAKGHIMAPLDLDPGHGPLDRYIDVAPYRQNPHLKLAISGYAITSIGIIIRKAI